MTFIIDMASGKEYLGEELSCPNDSKAKVTPAMEYEYPQLQLAVAETPRQDKPAASILTGLDIEALIKDI